MSFAQTSQRFSVGIASLVRWSAKEPKFYRHKRGLEIDLALLTQDVRDYPDAYQYERAARFDVATNAIWQALRKLGVTYKKALRHPKADDDKRWIFQASIEDCRRGNRPIVYFDGRGFAHDMPRTHGYAPRGKCCFGVQDWYTKGCVNVLGALLAGALLSVGLTTSNVDVNIFNLWLEHDLIPKLPPALVIVMDHR